MRAKPIQYSLIVLGILLNVLLFSRESYSAKFNKPSSYQTCFSPGKHCTDQIVELINQAHHQIQLASYSFTSWPIARALIRAYQRGVTVSVITDKSQFKQKSLIQTLMKHDIPVWVDDTVTIAHNKYLIVDGKTLETGSFNYTVSANRYNAENVLIIHNAALAHRYQANFQKRLQESTPASSYHYQPSPYYKTRARRFNTRKTSSSSYQKRRHR